MTSDDALARGRAAFDRRAWTEAYAALIDADATSALELGDLERAGLAAELIGRDDEATALMTRAHQRALEDGAIARASRHGFWLAMMAFQRGDAARGGGWLGRAVRLLEETDSDVVERGYVALPEAIRTVDADPAAALPMFERIAAIADRFGDRDLAAMGALGRGRSLIGVGEVAQGVALLDEAMLAATSDELSPIVVGIVYCAAIEAFDQLYDIRRAQGWTQALTEWCARQPDMVPFRGRCLVYRSDLLRFHGEWTAAVVEAERAREWLLRPPPEPAVGEAYYAEAELHRLRGEYGAADAAYREASQWGRRPDPGLALLALARGRVETARAMIERAVDEAADDIVRARLLPAFVDIAIAAGDVDGASAAVDALADALRLRPTPLLAATVARLEGDIALARDDARGALAALRRADDQWRDLDAPYEAARVRAAIGDALQRLGDEGSAALEFDAALRIFRDLGAEPDIRRAERLAGRPVGRSGGLSDREIEVLRLVADGRTNRAIANDLGISERTIDRHVSNIFTKLGVSSRAAATAYAYEHDLA
jgi:DNA-binding CsgD family transcriptional regulator